MRTITVTNEDGSKVYVDNFDPFHFCGHIMIGTKKVQFNVDRDNGRVLWGTDDGWGLTNKELDLAQDHLVLMNRIVENTGEGLTKTLDRLRTEQARAELEEQERKIALPGDAKWLGGSPVRKPRMD